MPKNTCFRYQTLGSYTLFPYCTFGSNKNLFKGTVACYFVYIGFLKFNFKTIIVLETMSENFSSLQKKIEPIPHIWSSPVISMQLNSHFNKRNKELINLCSYSYTWFEVFLKVLVIIIIRFGENNVCGYIYICVCVCVYIYVYIDRYKHCGSVGYYMDYHIFLINYL